MKRHQGFALAPAEVREKETERDASARMRRHQAFALPPICHAYYGVNRRWQYTINEFTGDAAAAGAGRRGRR